MKRRTVALVLVLACAADADEGARELELYDGSRIKVFVDPDTGCEYLVDQYKESSLQPRLAADGVSVRGCRDVKRSGT